MFLKGQSHEIRYGFLVSQLKTLLYVKGTVQQDFWTPIFFIIRTNLGHWPMG